MKKAWAGGVLLVLVAGAFLAGAWVTWHGVGPRRASRRTARGALLRLPDAPPVPFRQARRLPVLWHAPRAGLRRRRLTGLRRLHPVQRVEDHRREAADDRRHHGHCRAVVDAAGAAHGWARRARREPGVPAGDDGRRRLGPGCLRGTDGSHRAPEPVVADLLQPRVPSRAGVVFLRAGRARSVRGPGKRIPEPEIDDGLPGPDRGRDTAGARDGRDSAGRDLEDPKGGHRYRPAFSHQRLHRREDRLPAPALRAWGRTLPDRGHQPRLGACRRLRERRAARSAWRRRAGVVSLPAARRDTWPASATRCRNSTRRRTRSRSGSSRTIPHIFSGPTCSWTCRSISRCRKRSPCPRTPSSIPAAGRRCSWTAATATSSRGGWRPGGGSTTGSKSPRA